MDIGFYEPLFEFCKSAHKDNEKRIVHCRTRGKVVPAFLSENKKLFDIIKWTIKEDSLLYRAFIAKEFDDVSQNTLIWNMVDGKIVALSILHMLSSKIVACEMSFALNNPFAFPKYFLPDHEVWMRNNKAKLLIYPIQENNYQIDVIDKYLKRKSISKLLKKLKRYENIIKFENSFMNIFYLKIARKESFMTLMKEIL